jgi:deoxyadenosine/deoxycytidine kinase
VSRRYLSSLEKLYDQWIAHYDASPMLVLDTDRLDYVEGLFDRLQLLNEIERLVGVPPQRS